VTASTCGHLFDSNHPIAPLVLARYDLVRHTAGSIRALLGGAALTSTPLSVQIYFCPPDYFLQGQMLHYDDVR